MESVWEPGSRSHAFSPSNQKPCARFSTMDTHSEQVYVAVLSVSHA